MDQSWDELLCKVGKNIEDAGRMLRGRGRKKPKVWSIEDLELLRDALRDGANVLGYRIEALKDE